MLNRLRRSGRFLAVLAVPVLAAGCNDDDDNITNPPVDAGIAQVRVVHLSPDAPAVDVAVNGTVAVDGGTLRPRGSGCRDKHRGPPAPGPSGRGALSMSERVLAAGCTDSVRGVRSRAMVKGCGSVGHKAFPHRQTEGHTNAAQQPFVCQ